ncbi:hypothetical protein QR680_004801 [Steinernema hermaphroditum]|uniref:Enoyl-CoA hydratase n=1 Tax=Steinernema hermaphroditum TaxID=289476 RepID=A0AA39HQY8_9BILA|nr:hypothetical protein QR680_004801 [Steinernema hermaphroditum]
MEDFEYIVVRTDEFVSVVRLRFRERGNSINLKMWSEIYEAFKFLSTDPKTRVVVLSGDGEHFCSGIDMNEYREIITDLEKKKDDIARQSLTLRQRIECCQKTLSAIEKCPKPVIAAIHGQCIGGGFGLATACDIRLSTHNAMFALKEVDIAVIADYGPLSRFPKICKHSSWLRDIAFTGRKFDAAEALKHCFVSTIYDSQKDLVTAALKMADVIADKSPVAMQASKMILNFARDRKRKDAEKFGNAIRMLSVQSEDVKESLKEMEDSDEKLEFDEY